MAHGEYQDTRLVELQNTLDYNNDSIDVARHSKASPVGIFSGITATTTGANISCTGCNGILIEYEATAITSGNLVVKLTGNVNSATGTFKDIYSTKTGSEVLYSTTITANQSRQVVFGPGLPDNVKVVSTKTTDGTLSLTAQPIHL